MQTTDLKKLSTVSECISSRMVVRRFVFDASSDWTALNCDACSDKEWGEFAADDGMSLKATFQMIM